MSRTLIGLDGFNALFASVTRSSWRWECQGDYEVDHEAMRRWLNGEPEIEDDDDRAWLRYIRGLRAAGIPFERVRMLTEPLTDYLYWMLDVTGQNVAAGEDIRWVSQSRARELDMPEYDFYVFDANRVVILRFDNDKVLTGAELIDDEKVVGHHMELRDRIWPYAVAHDDYVRTGPAERGT